MFVLRDLLRTSAGMAFSNLESDLEVSAFKTRDPNLPHVPSAQECQLPGLGSQLIAWAPSVYSSLMEIDF